MPLPSTTHTHSAHQLHQTPVPYFVPKKNEPIKFNFQFEILRTQPRAKEIQCRAHRTEVRPMPNEESKKKSRNQFDAEEHCCVCVRVVRVDA